MEKKFLPYLPARVLKRKKHWYIVFYQTDPDKPDQGTVRFRRTYGLNKIKNKRQRWTMANRVVQEINQKLRYGYPFVEVSIDPQRYLSLKEAIDLAHKVKCRTDRKRTIQMYDSVRNVFGYWMKDAQVETLEISLFRQKHAVEFMDWLLVEREVGGRTYNNYIVRMKALFKALVVREHLPSNPFRNIEKRKETKKIRRMLMPAERRILSGYIRDHDPLLFMAILLEYHCFMRPNEIRQLKFKMFDLVDGVITIPASISKNRKERIVTIPKIDMSYFLNKEFTKYPANYYVFGSGGQPHPNKTVGVHFMLNRHKAIVKKLASLGMLQDTKGITYYSWKDTGITDAATNENVVPTDLRDQAGHHSIDQTMAYYHARKVNQGMRNVQNRIDG
ncbi:MAG: site-specific integrase [Bacteroidota bacterium]